MEIKEIISSELERLPEHAQKELLDFFEFLLQKYGIESSLAPKLTVREFGFGKGIFGNMAEDFDEPLEDFKEYM